MRVSKRWDESNRILKRESKSRDGINWNLVRESKFSKLQHCWERQEYHEETWEDFQSLRLQWMSYSEYWCEKHRRTEMIIVVIIIITKLVSSIVTWRVPCAIFCQPNLALFSFCHISGDLSFVTESIVRFIRDLSFFVMF